MDWSGDDILTLKVTDGSNVGTTGGPLSSVGEVQITVIPVNDPPEIILDQKGAGLLPGGGAFVTDEDVSFSLELLSVVDVEMSAGDRGRLVVSLQCSNGGFLYLKGGVIDSETLPLEVVWTVGGGTVGAGDGPWPAVVFSGGPSEASRALWNLEYVPWANWHGIDDIVVSQPHKVVYTFA